MAEVRDLFASRWFRLSVLLWVVGFFVVFVPAHRRGVVTLPAGQLATAETTSPGSPQQPYCPLCKVTSGGEPTPADAPTTCAICHLKANLIVPPAAVLAPSFIDELRFALYELPQTAAVSVSPQHRILGRAPPTHA